jgi:Domain of unknown function (DUF4258)
MIIIFSNHARKRIEERRLDELQVRKCLAEPDAVLDSKNSENLGILKLNGNVLVVVYKKTDDILFVITAFRSSKINRYIKRRSAS